MAAAITMRVATQLNIPIENAPMQLAKVAGALADGGVSIEGLTCTDTGAETTLHIVPDKVNAAAKALEAAGYTSTSQQIFSFLLSEDRPGIIANIARKCGEAGINISNIYSSSSGPKQPAVIFLWVAEEDFEKAKEVVGKIQ